MNDYTPPTEQVREIYSEIRHESTGLGLDPHRAEFDRWLEQVKAEAWHEGYGCGRDDQEAETRTNQMHVTLNPYRKAQTND